MRGPQSCTSMSTSLIQRADQLELLVAGVRATVGGHADWPRTARLVADQLRAHLPEPEVLTPKQRLGSADGPAGQTLHVERDGSFSITAVVWRAGQLTRIHDHTTWCVFGVIQGAQREDIFDSDLNLIGYADSVVGDVSGFAPPGDIHRVLNPGEETAISLHIYGTDVARIGSSVRRYYDLPTTT
jgi:predicted metal-dependent enzyme (double-stranded beta helix superfamily)